ncbi:EAL domain-containing protein [Schlegelella aquatica]|uniref:sensor domain-containing protein n=1 Tax=Caldimonas aquatica TaxID=376175 RepID=UPI0037512B21
MTSAEQIQTLIDGMLEAVWIVDPLDLRIKAANRAAHDLLGVPGGSLVGRAVIELACTPEDVLFWEDAAAGLADRILSETLVARADGRMVHVERRISRAKLGPTVSYYVVGMRDRSEQQRVEDELEKLIAELRATLESTADGILAVDLQGTIRGYNERFAQLWELPRRLLTRRDDQGVFAWMRHQVADPQAYLERLELIERSPLLEATDTLVLRNGKIIERQTLPQCSRGRPIGRVYSFRDITERVATESRLQLGAKVFEASLDGIFVCDPQLKLITVNPSFERLTGHPRQELIGQAADQLLQGASGQPLPFDRIRDVLHTEGLWEGELDLRQKGGHAGPCHLSLVRVPDERGRPLHFIGFVRDLSDKHAARRRIEELAYTDGLTGLPNRLLLNERIEFALALARRDQGPLAVLFVDLDRFKQINDSLGHAFGDRVLAEVAGRLKACVREVDTVARLGGDEFVVLVHQADARRAEMLARRILGTMGSPFALDDVTFTVTCSIGIALYPNDGITATDLIKNADAAMFRVKERGRAGFRFYQPQMNVDLLSRMKLDHAMRQGLPRGDFSLHYQPQVDLKTGAVVGAEALLRWRDEELGQVPPGRFIPVAEESGFIVTLGEWVLTQAVGQAARWHRAGRRWVVSINVSALQFQQPDFLERVASALAVSGLPADLLELELTESILVHDLDETLARLKALAKLGVRMAIDDFGTGYSSLGYLKRFPIRKLKIDRSFVNGLPSDESDVGIVRAIVHLARALGLKVIAEGVETQAQRQFLLEAGVDEFQGFLYSPAVPAEAFEATQVPTAEREVSR